MVWLVKTSWLWVPSLCLSPTPLKAAPSSRYKMKSLQHLERFLIYFAVHGRFPQLATDHLQGLWALLDFPITSSHLLYRKYMFWSGLQSTQHLWCNLLSCPSLIGTYAQPSSQSTSPFSLCIPKAHSLKCKVCLNTYENLHGHALKASDLYVKTKSFTAKRQQRS